MCYQDLFIVTTRPTVQFNTSKQVNTQIIKYTVTIITNRQTHKVTMNNYNYYCTRIIILCAVLKVFKYRIQINFNEYIITRGFGGRHYE